MRRRQKKHSLNVFTKFFLLIIVSFFSIWGFGFYLFVNEIPRSEFDMNLVKKADGIVVLTGGAGRLELGLSLLISGKAKKLLISGVDIDIDKRKLLKKQQIDILKIDCCVILGHKANNTFGNAMETARWMASEGFSSIHIVTANYHLPRSLLEFDRVLPNMKLFSHVVHPEKVHLNEWWRWPGTIRLLLAEYNKYLVTKLRILIISN